MERVGSASATGRRARDERRRLSVPAWYSPVAHLTFSALLTAGIVGALAVELVSRPVRPWAWLCLPAALGLGNAIEYAIHRWPMHRRMRPFDRFFRGHTLVHHRVFDHRDFAIEGLRDVYFVLTTTHTTLLSVLLLGLVWLAARATLGADVAALGCIGLASYALAVELMHLVLHLPARPGARWPLGSRTLELLREHHRLHHDPRRMTKINFNLAFPFTDLWLRTRARAAGRVRN